MVDTGGADKAALSFQKSPWGLFTDSFFKKNLLVAY